MPQITAENMVAGFCEALKNKDINEANTYLSLSAFKNKENYSISLYDFVDYLDGDIINIDFEGHNSHESRREETQHYSRIYTYLIETAGQLLE